MPNFHYHSRHVICTFAPYCTRYYEVSRSGDSIYYGSKRSFRRVVPGHDEPLETSVTPQIVFRTYGTGQFGLLGLDAMVIRV